MEIYWDLQNHELLSANASSQIITDLDLYLTDNVPVTLYLCRPAASGDDEYTVEDPPTGYTVVFGMREAADLVSGSILASQTTWTVTGSGTTSQAAADISMGDAALVAAIGTDTELDCIGEFVLRHATDGDRDTTQFSIKVKLDVNR